MPGKHVIGIVDDLRRESEGDYICPLTTVFGLTNNERSFLGKSQAKLNLREKLTDRHKTGDEIQISASCWKVIRILGLELGFELKGGPTKGCEPGGGITNLIWTMVKDASVGNCDEIIAIELTNQ